MDGMCGMDCIDSTGGMNGMGGIDVIVTKTICNMTECMEQKLGMHSILCVST